MHNGPSYGAGVPRYDQPNMPNYAWPSYAAYPNYAAVTYPKQYSASAWPYIGPFYPYPQVPWDGAKSPSNGMTECGTSTTRASNPPGDQETWSIYGKCGKSGLRFELHSKSNHGGQFFLYAPRKERSIFASTTWLDCIDRNVEIVEADCPLRCSSCCMDGK